MREIIKNYGFIIGIAITAIMLLLYCCNKNTENRTLSAKNEKTLPDVIIQNDIINNFIELSKVPRPSYHTEKISDYLYKFGESRGFKTIRDNVNNIIMEIPATYGYENLDKIILQTHMDMVFNTNLNLDPLTTPINVINDGEYLRSDGKTSLGADDGIGMAIVLAIADGKMAHGPLTLIITVDEEVTMKGSKNIDKSYINDSQYLINVDSENSSEVSVGCAGATDITLCKKCNFVPTVNDEAINIHLYDLLGGHSGKEIDKNRVNGIIALFNSLNYLYDNGIKYMLSECNNGSVRNAIPSDVSVTIIVDKKDLPGAKKLIYRYFEELKNDNISVEKNMKYEINEVKSPDFVIEIEESNIISRCITDLHNGVYTMSKVIDGAVESSSNIGIVKLDGDNISIEMMARSIEKSRMDEIIDIDKKVADRYGINIATNLEAEIWSVNENSKLLDVTKKAYKELFNEDIKVVSTHFAVECGIFEKSNPSIDMISIGPDVIEPHSTNEKVFIPSIMKTWKLLQKILLSL